MGMLGLEYRKKKKGVQKMNLVEKRIKGIGNGFTVIDPKDGYRKDNTLWFGKCSECGEQVVSSLMSAKNTGWTHEVRTGIQYHASGNVLTYSSRAVDYCPKSL
jgi:hypothetical protein